MRMLRLVKAEVISRLNKSTARFRSPDTLEEFFERSLPSRTPNRWRKFCCIGVAGLAAAVPFQGTSAKRKNDVWSWIERNILQRVAISGSRTFGYHKHDVEGDQEAFNSLTYSGLGAKSFTDIGAMSMTGRNVGGLLNFNSTIINNRYADPQAGRTSIDYDSKPLKINIGDIHGSLLNTNRFAAFRKYLKGAQAHYTNGRFAIKGVASEVRGSAKTISLQGTNSAGPYYLQHSQIVRGTEEVQLDGQPMKLGEDYVINYELGSITFVSRIIPPTSTIVVSFEALGFNTGFGRVMGVGASYDMGKYGRIGLTQMSQDTGGGDALSTRVELNQGAGPPSVPYFLEFEPLLTRPIVVKLDGIVQIEGVDYHFDPDNPTIFFFNRFVPLTSTIEVTYTPRPTSTVDGDRRVYGIDYRLPIGKRGHVSYYQATGKLLNDANPLSGTARGMDFSYRTGGWDVRAGVRKIPNGYVSVETRGFNRNEEAYDWGARYEGKKFEIDATGSDSEIGLRRVNSSGDLSFTTARTRQMRANAKYRPEVGTTWDLEHTQIDSKTIGSDTKLNRTALTTGRSFGRLLLRAGLEQQNGRGPVSDGTSTTVSDVDLRTLSLDGSYTAGEAWAFKAKVGFSDVKTSTKDGTGVDHQLGLTYSPSSRFNLAATYSKSDSGALATLGGFQTGFGLGYGGNGFSGGLTGTGFANGATDVELFQIAGTYRFSDRASIVANAGQSKSFGSITSNSESKSLNVGVDWDLGRGYTTFLSFSHSDTQFSGFGSTISADTLDFDFAANPRGNLSYRFGASIYVSDSGNELFGQDSAFYDASLTYRMAPRQAVSLFANSGRRTGYLPQDESHYGLAYSYQLYGNVALTASYRIRDVRNLSKTETSGAYKSKGFDIELTFNFGG